VEWSVEAARTVADGVVVVVPIEHGDDGPMGAFIDEAMVDVVVIGGTTRSASVRAGMTAVPEDADVIIVHDAARPLASPELFAAVTRAVTDRAIEGAIPVVPVTDTLKRVADGVVESTVDRTGLVSVQTPQAFVAATLRAAHAGDGETTDDAGLLEQMGATVRTVPGEPSNLKLTYPEDLALAAELLRIRASDG
jgi:2-C-methyl-D-erythritol 4-phosphate cytidylyltransferase